MANKQVFTAFDVYGFKKALAYHAAKQNFLLNKWRSVISSYEKDIAELHGFAPTADRDNRIKMKEKLLQIVRSIIADIESPADSYLSDFEMRDCK